MPTPTAPASTGTPSASPTTATTAQPSQSANQPITAAKAPAQQPTAQERRMKVKLDGKEVEVPESEVVANYQQRKIADQRFQEAAKIRKEAEAVMKFAKDNPAEFFAKTGMNAREWAEKYLLEQLQVEAMSPEQKKARENEDKLKKYEQEEKTRKDQQQKEYVDRLTTEKRVELDKLFTQALYESGLPRTPWTVAEMARLQLANVKKGWQLTPAQLAKQTRENYVDAQKALMGALEGDQLLEFLGPDLVNKLSKAQISKLKGKTPTAPSTQSKPARKQDNTEPGLSWTDYQRRNRGKK